jgi:hypothetical protein
LVGNLRGPFFSTGAAACASFAAFIASSSALVGNLRGPFFSTGFSTFELFLIGFLASAALATFLGADFFALVAALFFFGAFLGARDTATK